MMPQKRQFVVALAIGLVAAFGLLVRDNITQVAWYGFFILLGIVLAQVTVKRMGSGRAEAVLFASTAAASLMSILFDNSVFWHGRWIATPLVNIYTPALLILMIPLPLWLMARGKGHQALTAASVVLVLGLVMQSFDGLLVCFALFFALINSKGKAAKAALLAGGAVLCGLLIYQDFRLASRVGDNVWNGIQLFGSSGLAFTDTWFTSSVLSGSNYAWAEVLVCFGLVAAIVMLVGVAILLIYLFKEKEYSFGVQRQLSTACVVLFGSKTLNHLVWMKPGWTSPAALGSLALRSRLLGRSVSGSSLNWASLPA